MHDTQATRPQASASEMQFTKERLTSVTAENLMADIKNPLAKIMCFSVEDCRKGFCWFNYTFAEKRKNETKRSKYVNKS